MNGIKTMRAELGLSQIELAAALHTSFTSVNRWENDKARPSRLAFSTLLEFAGAHGVSRSCIEEMQSSFEMTRSRQNTGHLRVGTLPPIDRELLCQLVEESEAAIYVTDAETDTLLYANRALEQVVGKSRESIAGQKCYQFLANRDTPCPYCRKNQLVTDKYLANNVESAADGRLYTCKAKVISWNGRCAHVRYLTGISNDEVLQNIAVGVCVYTVNPDGTLALRYANDGYFALCEGTSEELTEAYRQDHLFGVCEEHKTRVRDFFVKIIASGQSDELVYRCKSLKGNIKWVNAKATYVAGNAATRNKIYCTFVDITESVLPAKIVARADKFEKIE